MDFAHRTEFLGSKSDCVFVDCGFGDVGGGDHGPFVRGLFRRVGLGIVDRLLGAAFGLVKGCIVVTLVLMGVVAFLARQNWLVTSRLAPAF